MRHYEHERDPVQVAADELERSADAVKSAAKMRADLAKAKANDPDEADAIMRQMRVGPYARF